MAGLENGLGEEFGGRGRDRFDRRDCNIGAAENRSDETDLTGLAGLVGVEVHLVDEDDGLGKQDADGKCRDE